MSDPTAADPGPEPLQFETDKGASRSFWVATAILLALVGWMGSGFVLPSEEEAADEQAPERGAASVVVERSTAETVTLTFRAEGQALPDRDTALRAESTGEVVEILADKGDRVEAEQPIARLSSTRADADLARAAEERTRAQRELDNATQLRERGVGTADRVAEARAALAAAEAQVTSAEQALADLTILAPFPGRIETLGIDLGEFVSAGTELGRIVDNQPLTIQIQIPQQALGRISDGLPAEVSFITGETLPGEITFVGTAAANQTRTFLAEIEVANADGAIPAGLSAEVLIPTGEAKAHFVSPSIVSLDADGTLGVKTREEGKVRFYPIEIVRSELDGIWVTGLPDSAEIITIGQGFVQDGEPVEAEPPADADALATADGAVPDGALPGSDE